MPFTVSHIAGVLPFTSKRLSLPFAALAIGSMAPDQLYFIPPLIQYGTRTHEAPYLFTANLVLGLAAWVLWRLIAPLLHDVAPEVVRERWRPDTWTSHPWWSVPVAIWIGIATHIALDHFTHSWGWGTRNIEAIAATYATPVGLKTGYELMQIGLSALGLVIILGVLLLQKRSVIQPSRVPTIQRLTFPLVLCAGVFGAIARTAVVGGFDSRFEALAFYLLTGAVAGVVLALTALCLLAAIARGRIAERKPEGEMDDPAAT
jgi:hypothetical protein